MKDEDMLGDAPHEYVLVVRSTFESARRWVFERKWDESIYIFALRTSISFTLASLPEHLPSCVVSCARSF